MVTPYKHNTIEVLKLTTCDGDTFMVQRAGCNFHKTSEAQFMRTILAPHTKQYEFYTVEWKKDVDNPNISELDAITLGNAILTLNRLGFKSSFNAPGNGPFDKAFQNIMRYCTGEELLYD